MFKNTPFESIAKTMTESAEKFNPTAMQDAIKPIQESLKAWGDLAQAQALAAQSAMAATAESFKSIKEPQAAFEAMKASAESTLAMATKNLKDVTVLSVAQFKSTVDTLEKSSPAPEAFAGVAKGMKEAATTIETALDSAMKTGTAAVKKTRA